MPIMERIILFAKRPVEGAVKTRLIPLLGSGGALELHRAMLADALSLLRSLAAPERERELCLDGAPDRAELPEEFDERISLTRQGAGDLGARMLRAFRRSAASGCEATVIVGADAPTLPARTIEQALERLRSGSPAVVCPSHDGGYILIGLRRPRPALFRDVPWGGDGVLRATRERAAAEGIGLDELEPWYDVDRPEDLRRLREEFGRGVGGRAPATRRFLASRER